MLNIHQKLKQIKAVIPDNLGYSLASVIDSTIATATLALNIIFAKSVFYNSISATQIAAYFPTKTSPSFNKNKILKKISASNLVSAYLTACFEIFARKSDTCLPSYAFG